MRDVLAAVRGWYADGERFALATVIDTFRSAPRQPGATMAVSADGVVVGSVSGGCVEGDVYAVAQEVIRTGVPVVRRYGISDDDVFAIGLTCGGVLDVLVEPVDRATFAEFGAVAEAIEAGRPVAVATVVTAGEHLGRRLVIRPSPSDPSPSAASPSAASPSAASPSAASPSAASLGGAGFGGAGVVGSLGDPGLDGAVVEDARGMLGGGSAAMREYGVHGECGRAEVAVFVQAVTPPPRMFVFGAIDFAAAVARVGKFLGYHVTVCDARGVFATRARFPEADEVVVDWPHRFLAGVLDSVDSRTALCVLTHDPKFDVPLLELALRTDAGYIGAMGSRRTHEDRLVRLRAAGVTEAELARMSSPTGLDLGARTPEETAISIAAEIIASRSAASARPLSTTTGRIHASILCG
ncbi:xanthine dehydrogenase accessory factor [Kribbella aluminosa]|uniref:Xanthine dehydrogenase accessory factor n=1 Tax=Kribbella aluminosa TaxID=416017 RepID=A0ABS4UCY1_9ACTN|nr:XdhC/CoxI family protein [Kribbella aluminosa]MBP2349490.1 xanthine dehydrogenase accessory factor [Kribbella aluminosa]